MSTDIVFADLQGFHNFKNDFIIKEFAYATKEYTQVYLVKPPYPFSKLAHNEKKTGKMVRKE